MAALPPAAPTLSRYTADGKIVLYQPAEIRATVENSRTARVQGDRIPLATVEQVFDPRYLGLLERHRRSVVSRNGTRSVKATILLGHYVEVANMAETDRLWNTTIDDLARTGCGFRDLPNDAARLLLRIATQREHLHR